MPLTVQDDYPV